MVLPSQTEYKDSYSSDEVQHIVALKMLQDHLEQAPSVISAAEKWRGVGRQSDSQYFDKVLAALEGADGPASRND